MEKLTIYFFALNDLFSWPSPLTLKKGMNYLILWVLLNRYGQRIFQKVARRPIQWSFAFPLSTMLSTRVDDLLDAVSQKRFTAISSVSYLPSLWSSMPIWWVVIQKSAQNLLHRVSILTVVKWSVEKLNMQMSKCHLYKCQMSLSHVHKVVTHPTGPSNIPDWKSWNFEAIPNHLGAFVV